MVIDCSTIGIDYAKKIHAAAHATNIAFVESPVSGGTEGARDGTLTFMLGCDSKHSGKAKEMLQPLGDYIAYVGGPGAGQDDWNALCAALIAASTSSAVAKGTWPTTSCVAG